MAPLHARERGICHFLISFVKFSEAEESVPCAPLLSFLFRNPTYWISLLQIVSQSKARLFPLSSQIVLYFWIHLEASPPPVDSETTWNQVDVPPTTQSLRPALKGKQQSRFHRIEAQRFSAGFSDCYLTCFSLQRSKYYEHEQARQNCSPHCEERCKLSSETSCSDEKNTLNMWN